MSKRAKFILAILLTSLALMPVTVVTPAQAATTVSCSAQAIPYWIGYCTATITYSGTGAFVDKIVVKFDRCLPSSGYNGQRIDVHVGPSLSLGGGYRWKGSTTNACGRTWDPPVSTVRADRRVYAYDGDLIVATFKTWDKEWDQITRQCSRALA